MQFIDVGTKVVSESVEIYQSASGASALNQESELLAGSITVIDGQLGKSLRANGSYDVLGQYETHLEDLRLRSQALAQELLGKLDKLKVDKGKHKLELVRSVGKALRSVISKGTIDDLQNRLNRLKADMELHITIDIK